jgi:NADH-quinone oxidoreductase subunit L
VGCDLAAGSAGDPVGADRFLTIEPMLFGDFFKGVIHFSIASSVMAELGEEFHGAVGMAIHGMTTLPFILAMSGVAVAFCST